MAVISAMSAAVGAGGTVDVQPAAGVGWLINHVANDVAFVGNVPDLQLAIRDGVVADAIVTIDPTTDPGNRTRPRELYITNTNWLRITNTGGAGANVAYSGEEVRADTIITDLVAVGAGASTDIQPPAGQTWLITEYGYSVLTLGGDINPDCIVGITDGTLVNSMLIQQTMVRGHDKPQRILIDNTLYLRVTDGTGAAGGIFGYSGIRVPETSIGSLTDVVGSATLDIQPPATQEWEILDIGAETWGGAGAPNDYPDIMVSLMVGANLSELLEAGSVATSLLWNQEMRILLTNATFLRITEVSTGNNEVCVLGRLLRQFS